MSRFLYWTILLGDEPTSFRAAEAAELKPTLVQLQRTNPNARLVWFERGRIWGSPAEAQAARRADRTTRRPSTWRPGGTHVDPRQKYKDAKKAKWTRFKEGIRKRAEDRRAFRPERPAFEERPKRTTAEILADWKPPPAAGARRPAADRHKPTQTTRGRDSGPPASGPKPKRAPLRHDSRRPWGSKPRPQTRDDRGPRKPRKD